MQKGTHFKQKSVEEVLKAIENNHGNLSASARELGMSRYALQVKIKKNPVLQEKLNDERDSFIDEAEAGLYEHVKEFRSLPAIMFTLKTIGKERGWGESQEILMNANINADIDLSVLSLEELKQLNELAKKSIKSSSD